MIQTAMPTTAIAPALTHVEACAWCWPLLHPGQDYPESWSSTICQTHQAWILERARARRATRTQERERQEVEALA